MKQNIIELKKEIERISNLPDELYSNEKLEIAKAKLQTLQKVCKEIEKDIKFQKEQLKDKKKYFEYNKPFMWRIHGFKSLLSKISGEQIKLFGLSEEKNNGR